MTPARLGARVQFGRGTQHMSWISLQDAVGAICAAVHEDTLAGPVNVTGPEPATNAEFAREFSRALGRSGVGCFPGPVLNLAAGRERTQEILLSSQRALPSKLLSVGFEFQHAHLTDALQWAVMRRD